MNIEQLQRLKTKEIIEYYKTLEAPDFEEMDGEFEATMVGRVTALPKLAARLIMYNPYLYGQWSCKAFTPDTPESGHGYNCFNKVGKTKRLMRMNTRLAKSSFDNKPVFELSYGSYNNLLGRTNTVDELRKITGRLYLGIGTTAINQEVRVNPMPFVLTGPVSQFVGADKRELKRR